jgi:outer membrane protein OmpA-like peptidoglycan-associated protein
MICEEKHIKCLWFLFKQYDKLHFVSLLMKFLFIFFLLTLSSVSFSQNLLTNGGFEEENICTEYGVNCAPEGWISSVDAFANYYKNAGRAYKGEHCIAIEAGFSYKPFQRTFFRSRLLCGLRKNHQYRLEFYIKSPHDILDSIGVLFTSFDFLFGQKKLQNITPAFFIKPVKGSFVNDTSWQKVSMNYTAAGDEAFISIANFSRHDINGATNILMEKHFFVFIDDISLRPLDRREGLCDGWQKNKQDIYDQDERHEFLRQSIRQNKNDPPVVLVRPFTSLEVTDTLIIPDVLFATAKSELRKDGLLMLDTICNKLRTKRIDSVVVEGHTDNTGTVQLNDRLAAERAWSVESAIRERMNLPGPSVITRGWGDRKPVADNSTAAGRQLNRRVELYVYTRE